MFWERKIIKFGESQGLRGMQGGKRLASLRNLPKASLRGWSAIVGQALYLCHSLFTLHSSLFTLHFSLLPPPPPTKFPKRIDIFSVPCYTTLAMSGRGRKAVQFRREPVAVIGRPDPRVRRGHASTAEMREGGKGQCPSAERLFSQSAQSFRGSSERPRPQLCPRAKNIF